MKYLSILLIVGALFFACKTEAGSSSTDTDTPAPVIHNVTVIPNGASGLKQDVYPIEDGKTLDKLSNELTMKYATFTGFLEDKTNTPFELGKTTINRDWTVVMQWQWKDFSDCTNTPALTGSQLYDYISNGNVAGVACSLKTGSIDQPVYATFSAFGNAAQAGQLELMKYLLDKGADIKQRDLSNNTAILLASSLGNLDAVKYLHYKGMGFADTNDYQQTALLLAAQNGNLDLIKYLIPNSNIATLDKYGNNGLLTAAANGRLEAVKYFLTLPGVNINDKNGEGLTSLMLAVNSYFAPDSNTFPLDTVKYLATFHGISLKEQATKDPYTGMDALGVANYNKAHLPSNIQQDGIDRLNSIIAYLNSIW